MIPIQTEALSRILCLRLRSMGDVVLMTPAIHALRLGLPEAELFAVLDADLVVLLENHPDIDGVIPLGKGARSKIALASRCRRMGFDAVINFHGGPTSTWLTATSGAPLRVGRGNYRFSSLYNVRVKSPEDVFSEPKATHTVHSQASLVASLGIPVGDLALHVPVAPESRDRVRSRLEALNMSASDYIVIQPSASFPSKQWPAERFLQLARELRHRAGREVVLSLPATSLDAGRKSTRARSDFWNGVLQPRELPSLTGLPLDQLAALMDSAALYLGNDSGPMHLAAAVGTPVVGIFGSSNPRRWHPWGVPHRILWAGLACSPCHGKSCANPERFACLERIEVQAALDAALELLDV